MVHVPTQDDVRSHKRIVKMLIAIVTVYSVCMLPHHLYWMIIELKKVDSSVSETILSISYLFTYSNSVANPFVFFFYSNESRYHLKRFFHKLVCSRKMDVPFENKNWSGTWSGVSRGDSQRPVERSSSKEHLKLDKLFPPKTGESELGVSLPWEAQVMTSQASSESYRDYPSSPPIPGMSISREDPLEHRCDTANPFFYADLPPHISKMNSNKVIQNVVQNNECLKEDGKSVWYSGEETVGCDEDNRGDLSVKSIEGFVSDHLSESNQEEEVSKVRGEDEEITWDEEKTVSDIFEEGTTRLQHMIDRMIQDIRHDLNQDSGMNGTRKPGDILNLNESSSNSVWEATMNAEGSTNSVTLAEISAEDLLIGDMKGFYGSGKDLSEFRKQLECLPETRM